VDISVHLGPATRRDWGATDTILCGKMHRTWIQFLDTIVGIIGTGSRHSNLSLSIVCMLIISCELEFISANRHGYARIFLSTNTSK
jgi:hypothetical protein